MPAIPDAGKQHKKGCPCAPCREAKRQRTLLKRVSNSSAEGPQGKEGSEKVRKRKLCERNQPRGSGLGAVHPNRNGAEADRPRAPANGNKPTDQKVSRELASLLTDWPLDSEPQRPGPSRHNGGLGSGMEVSQDPGEASGSGIQPLEAEKRAKQKGKAPIGSKPLLLPGPPSEEAPAAVFNGLLLPNGKVSSRTPLANRFLGSAVLPFDLKLFGTVDIALVGRAAVAMKPFSLAACSPRQRFSIKCLTWWHVLPSFFRLGSCPFLRQGLRPYVELGPSNVFNSHFW